MVAGRDVVADRVLGVALHAVGADVVPAGFGILVNLDGAGADEGAAIEFVKNAMLHKDEATTFKYIKFLEVTKGKQEAAAAFTAAFTGLRDRNWNEFHA